MNMKKNLTLLLVVVVANFLIAAAVATAAAKWGYMPNTARNARVYVVPNDLGDENYLADLLGCVLDQPIAPGRSMQCGETFLYIGPNGRAELALNQIVNVHVDGGYVAEVRARPTNIVTTNGGRVGRALLNDGACAGANVEQCIGLRAEIVEFVNGWQIRAARDRLELIRPDGSLADIW